MFNKNILGHDFIDYIDDYCFIAIKYYKCSTCGLLICENYGGDISIIHGKQQLGLGTDHSYYKQISILNLTCDEYIIKNIIE